MTHTQTGQFQLLLTILRGGEGGKDPQNTLRLHKILKTTQKHTLGMAAMPYPQCCSFDIEDDSLA